jgi:protein-tyrosine phosphatase
VGTQPQELRRFRRLPFSGVKNLRDLGGYETTAGRTVRWGILYRSDALHKLTESDTRYLSTLGLHQIIDFRSSLEKQREPNVLPPELASGLVEIPILDSSTQVFHESRDDFVKLLKQLDSPKFMVDTNVELATHFTPDYRKFLDLLLASNGRPVLFHCAAGKDRTGFAAAIVLRILGVPQPVVMSDYLLTNKYFHDRYRWSLRLAQLMKGRRFAQTIRGFMIADEAYLGAAFAAIDRQHGSFENYVRNGLGITTEQEERIKSIYLA